MRRDGSCKMTAMHFTAIAATLKDTEPKEVEFSNAENYRTARQQWRHTARYFANLCARSNPNFDRERFLKACGMEE